MASVESGTSGPLEGESDPGVPLSTFQDLFDNCPEGILVLNADLSVLCLNRSFLRISGVPASWAQLPQAERQAHLVALLDDPARGVEFTRRAFAEGSAAAVLRLKDGRWMEAVARPLGGGRLVFYYRDVSSLFEAESALRASEERYRRMFESLHDVYYETDGRGTITVMSPSCLVHTGYTPDELVGTLVARVWADPAELAELLAGLRETGSVSDFEAHLQRKDGSIVVTSVNAIAVRDADGRTVRYQGTVRDITRRKQAEEERDQFFTLSVDLLAVTDARGRFVRVNPAWKTTLGYEPADLIGQSLWHFVALQDRAGGIALTRRALAGEAIGDSRLRFRAKDGTDHWLSWHFGTATPAGFVYPVVRDVTEAIRVNEELAELLEASRRTSRELEQQARELDRLRAEAVYQAAHDPLTGLLNGGAWFDSVAADPPALVALVDVDHFKSVNDTYGHPVGDEVLRELARRFSALLPGHRLGRLGGEEFGVAMTGDIASIRASLEDVVAAVRARPVATPAGPAVNITVSIGYAPWNPAENLTASISRTYEAADAALYRAKRHGRDRVEGPLPD